MFKLLTIVFLVAFTSLAIAQVNDPTKPLGDSGSAANSGSANDGINLMSILISDQRRVAVINGQMLRENQEINGADVIVKKIERDAVVLQQDNKIWRVSLNSTIVRKK